MTWVSSSVCQLVLLSAGSRIYFIFFKFPDLFAKSPGPPLSSPVSPFLHFSSSFPAISHTASLLISSCKGGFYHTDLHVGLCQVGGRDTLSLEVSRGHVTKWAQLPHTAFKICSHLLEKKKSICVSSRWQILWRCISTVMHLLFSLGDFFSSLF